MWATPVSLSEPVRAFLSLNHRADSLPETAVCVGQVVGFWERVRCQGRCPGTRTGTLHFLAKVLLVTG